MRGVLSTLFRLGRYVGRMSLRSVAHSESLLSKGRGHATDLPCESLPNRLFWVASRGPWQGSGSNHRIGDGPLPRLPSLVSTRHQRMPQADESEESIQSLQSIQPIPKERRIRPGKCQHCRNVTVRIVPTASSFAGAQRWRTLQVGAS